MRCDWCFLLSETTIPRYRPTESNINILRMYFIYVKDCPFFGLHLSLRTKRWDFKSDHNLCLLSLKVCWLFTMCDPSYCSEEKGRYPWIFVDPVIHSPVFKMILFFVVKADEASENKVSLRLKTTNENLWNSFSILKTR